MKRLVYVETSVWSRLADPPDQRAARLSGAFIAEVSRRHRILISDAVILEISRTPDPSRRQYLAERILEVRPRIAPPDERAERMADELLRLGRWRERRLVDLLHVAYTVLEKADALVTWDVDDLARERPRHVVHAYTRSRKLLTPLIGTPEEVAVWLGLKIDR